MTWARAGERTPAEMGDDELAVALAEFRSAWAPGMDTERLAVGVDLVHESELRALRRQALRSADRAAAFWGAVLGLPGGVVGGLIGARVTEWLLAVWS